MQRCLGKEAALIFWVRRSRKKSSRQTPSSSEPQVLREGGLQSPILQARMGFCPQHLVIYGKALVVLTTCGSLVECGAGR